MTTTAIMTNTIDYSKNISQILAQHGFQPNKESIGYISRYINRLLRELIIISLRLVPTNCITVQNVKTATKQLLPNELADIATREINDILAKQSVIAHISPIQFTNLIRSISSTSTVDQNGFIALTTVTQYIAKELVDITKLSIGQPGANTITVSNIKQAIKKDGEFPELSAKLNMPFGIVGISPLPTTSSLPPLPPLGTVPIKILQPLVSTSAAPLSALSPKPLIGALSPVPAISLTLTITSAKLTTVSPNFLRRKGEKAKAVTGQEEKEEDWNVVAIPIGQLKHGDMYYDKEQDRAMQTYVIDDSGPWRKAVHPDDGSGNIMIPARISRLIEDPIDFYANYLFDAETDTEFIMSIDLVPAVHQNIIKKVTGGRPVHPSRKVSYNGGYEIWTPEEKNEDKDRWPWEILDSETPAKYLRAIPAGIH